MRRILPMLAAATVLGTCLAIPATAKQSERRQRVAGHVSLHVSGHAVLSGERLAVHGRVRPAGRRQVKLVFRGPAGGPATARTHADGRFSLRWRAGAAGNYRVRAYVARTGHSRAGISPARRLTAFRYAGASYYGPGLYGNGVACGGTLLPDTLGVAHKSLPCGTRVKLRYRGRAITVPVIDRGPYVAGRDYDLTEAVKVKLGFPGVGSVLANR